MKLSTLIVLVAVGLLFSPIVANAIPFRPRGNIDGSLNLTNQTGTAKNGTQPFYNITGFKKLNATKVYGNLTWQFQAYPAACPGGTFISALGNSVTCNSPPASNTSTTMARLVISGKQPYWLNESQDNMRLRIWARNSSTAAGISLFPRDRDGTDTVDYQIFGQGNGNTTHYQKMVWRWNPPLPNAYWTLQSMANGGYASVPIDMAVDAFDKQLWLETDGSVRLFQGLLNATKGTTTTTITVVQGYVNATKGIVAKNISGSGKALLLGSNINMTNNNITGLNRIFGTGINNFHIVGAAGITFDNSATFSGSSNKMSGRLNMSSKNITNVIILAEGMNSQAPSYAFISDKTSGMFSGGAGTLSFGTASGTRMKLKATLLNVTQTNLVVQVMNLSGPAATCVCVTAAGQLVRNGSVTRCC